MKYSLCILDDDIPINEYLDFMDDKKIINYSNFKHLLKDEKKWKDTDLLNFVKAIFDKDFILTGFTSHSFFFNHIEDSTFFYPEIIIFDWDISGQTDDSKDNLLKILTESNSLVGVFTKADKKDEVSTIIDSEDFNDFKERCFIIKKQMTDSHNELYKQIEDKSQYFSFFFGNKIKKEAAGSIESILSKLSNFTMDNIHEILHIQKDNINELIEFIGEKFKNNLSSVNFEMDKSIEKSSESDTETQDIEAQQKYSTIDKSRIYCDLWNYRLYYKPKDDYIRKGDILKIADELFIIITPDCELFRFWTKTRGILNYVKLYDLNTCRTKIVDSYKNSFKLKKLKNIESITSISNSPTNLSASPLLFPYIEIDKEYKYYFLFPKELSFKFIDMPQDYKDITEIKQRDKPLLLSHLKGQRITTLSEPFLGSVIDHIFSSLKGYGCPDYPDEIRKRLTKQVKELFNEENS
ncbi:MAG: hypothetical protein JW891_17455 [Candidatus Lokiarchaeota archaeon]|nr:hypothetical protein [Candidatus Lokiarchaeota archaeon]